MEDLQQEKNEIRFYLRQVKALVEADEFTPQHIITATKLPTGAIEVAINTVLIAEKIDYILEAYDDDMRLKTNSDVVMQNLMVV